VDMEKAIEAFAQVPMGHELYVRPTWRELRKRPGRLDPDPYWKTTSRWRSSTASGSASASR